MSRSEDDAAADDIIACTAAPYSSAEPREGAKAVRKSYGGMLFVRGYGTSRVTVTVTVRFIFL